MDSSPVITALLTDLAGQIGMLILSMPLFALVGWVVYRSARKRGKIVDNRGFLNFLFPGHRYAHGQLRIDIWMLVASRMLWFPIINLLGLVLTVDLKLLLDRQFGAMPVAISTGPLLLAIQFIVSYLLIELGGYWAHRFLHTRGFLWTTHRAHHSAEVLTFLVGGRGHPLEHVVFLLCGLVCSGVGTGLFMYFTGTLPHPMLPIALIALGLFGALMDKISHSELPLSFGWLDNIFMSARMHQIHHSAEPHHYGRNYGGTMSIFDRLFGTLYVPTGDERFRLGLNHVEVGANNPHNTLKALYLEPFLYLRDMAMGKELPVVPDILPTPEGKSVADTEPTVADPEAMRPA
jgi:sterol desaturase/sphingolipid hydroxylase (fatty acid hydroxylase superfamily)